MKHKLISIKLFPAPASLSHTTLYGKPHWQGLGSIAARSSSGQHTLFKGYPLLTAPLISGFSADCSLVSMNCQLLISKFTSNTLGSRGAVLEKQDRECVQTSSFGSQTLKNNNCNNKYSYRNLFKALSLWVKWNCIGLSFLKGYHENQHW